MSGDQLERGLYEFEQGNFENAADVFSKIISNGDPDHVEALRKRSTCYYEMNQYQNSIDDANTILQLQPDSTSGYALRGNALAKLKQFEEALASFKTGLQIDSNDPEIKTGLKDMQADIMDHYEKKGEETTYNAVTMSSQDPYPGDGELESLEKEIMEKMRITEFPDLQLNLQDQKKSLKEYQTALQYRKAGNDPEALKKLRSALNYDAANFTLRGELALLLNEMGQHREAYQHCISIPGDFRPAKYWKLGGQILNSLELPVHAESWIRQACKLDKKDIEMKLLFQNIRVKRLYGPLTEGSKVNVVFTQYGRSIIASENISQGTNLFRDKAAVLAQTLDSLHVPACSFCAKCLMRPEQYFDKEQLSENADLRKIVKKYWPVRPKVECTKCGSKTIYCSEQCREEAWNTYHKILCSSVNPAVERLYEVCEQYKDLSNDSRCWKGWWNASFSPFVLAKIWASVLCLAINFASQNGRDVPSAADWAIAKSPFRKFIAYGNASNAVIIPDMVKLMQEIFDNDSLPEGWRYKINTREFDGRYFQAACNVQAFSDPSTPFHLFMNNMMMHEPKRDMVRLHTIKDPDDAMFAGMFPLHACLNHSCDNNVEVLDGHQGVLVRAKRPLKAGEELFTTYINPRMGRKERRGWLFRGYNFWCQCLRCKYEGDDASKCTHCGKEAAVDNKEKYPGCGKCQRAWYCSTACQKTAWKSGHKKICSKE